MILSNTNVSWYRSLFRKILTTMIDLCILYCLWFTTNLIGKFFVKPTQGCVGPAFKIIADFYFFVNIISTSFLRLYQQQRGFMKSWFHPTSRCDLLMLSGLSFYHEVVIVFFVLVFYSISFFFPRNYVLLVGIVMLSKILLILLLLSLHV